MPADVTNPQLPVTQRVQTVLQLATEQASDRGDVVVDTRHVLYGMVAEGGGVAAVALQDFGIDVSRLNDWMATSEPDVDMPRLVAIDDETALATVGVDLSEVRRRAEEVFGRGALDNATAPATPLGEEVLVWMRAAVNEARALGNNYVGTEHLLLAYTATGSGGAARLGTLGLSADALRGRVLQTIERLQHAAAQNPEYQALSRELVALQRHVEDLPPEVRRTARPVLAKLTAATSEAWARLYPNPDADGDIADRRRERFVEGIAAALNNTRAELQAEGVPLPT